VARTGRLPAAQPAAILATRHDHQAALFFAGPVHAAHQRVVIRVDGELGKGQAATAVGFLPAAPQPCHGKRLAVGQCNAVPHCAARFVTRLEKSLHRHQAQLAALPRFAPGGA